MVFQHAQTFQQKQSLCILYLHFDNLLVNIRVDHFRYIFVFEDYNILFVLETVKFLLPYNYIY